MEFTCALEFKISSQLFFKKFLNFNFIVRRAPIFFVISRAPSTFTPIAANSSEAFFNIFAAFVPSGTITGRFTIGFLIRQPHFFSTKLPQFLINRLSAQINREVFTHALLFFIRDMIPFSFIVTELILLDFFVSVCCCNNQCSFQSYLQEILEW